MNATDAQGRNTSPDTPFNNFAKRVFPDGVGAFTVNQIHELLRHYYSADGMNLDVKRIYRVIDALEKRNKQYPALEPFEQLDKGKTGNAAHHYSSLTSRRIFREMVDGKMPQHVPVNAALDGQSIMFGSDITGLTNSTPAGQPPFVRGIKGFFVGIIFIYLVAVIFIPRFRDEPSLKRLFPF